MTVHVYALPDKEHLDQDEVLCTDVLRGPEGTVEVVFHVRPVHVGGGDYACAVCGATSAPQTGLRS